VWVEFHLARANGHTGLLTAGVTTTLAFHGPHAFVHPGWYAAEHAVPTWNYAVVHATGTPEVIETLQDSLAMVNALTHFYDASHPAYTEDGVAGMLRGIVCYRMRVTTLEGKFKLSQNRSLADRVGVRTQLAQSPRERERDLAAMMRASEPVTE
jgi:transcriptional regulator